MKIDGLAVAALAVAGLAVAAYFRPRAAAANGTDAAFAMATQQRQASGAALSANTDYLASWARWPSMQQYGATQPDF